MKLHISVPPRAMQSCFGEISTPLAPFILMQMCLAHALLLHPFLIAVTGPFQLSTLHSPLHPVLHFLPPPPIDPRLPLSSLFLPLMIPLLLSILHGILICIFSLPNNSRNTERMGGMSDFCAPGSARGFKWRKFPEKGEVGLEMGSCWRTA
ncbi:hypothetical protein CDAR_32371 [Caerostris darwini]|uniref:Uncharacterized protein n=1 Tax=Caerostris darwini TaxID=1538125 RepID=A0AAV4WNS3_9ARAC|nr:hypothetical protein CDAR_32371 [Caerostris darwini]